MHMYWFLGGMFAGMCITLFGVLVTKWMDLPEFIESEFAKARGLLSISKTKDSLDKLVETVDIADKRIDLSLASFDVLKDTIDKLLKDQNVLIENKDRAMELVQKQKEIIDSQEKRLEVFRSLYGDDLNAIQKRIVGQ